MIDFGLGVVLNTVDSTHNSDLRGWRNDPSIWRWTRQNDLISEAEQSRWFDAQDQDPSIQMYLITPSSPDAAKKGVGVCGLTSINKANRSAEFSLYIAPDFQGQGLSKPALLTLFYHGFKNMGLKSIWGETFENNPAQKIFTDIGMVNDGRRRKFYWKDGRYWDALLFSVLSEEFLSAHGDKSCFPA